MYKNAKGKFITEVATYLPDEEYLNGKSFTFSGIIGKDDWNEEIIEIFT